MKIKESTNKYKQCNFCGVKKNIYEVSSDNENLSLVVSLCDNCIKELNNTINNEPKEEETTKKEKLIEEGYYIWQLNTTDNKLLYNYIDKVLKFLESTKQ